MGYLDDTGLTYVWTKIKTHVSNAVANKVDKVSGKGLSTNDYTTAEKDKLAGLTKITVDSALSSTSTNPVQNKVINTALAGKAAASHTHNYAGASTPGGAATKAIADADGNDIGTTYIANIDTDSPTKDGQKLYLRGPGDSPHGDLIVKGAVYSTMKGATSDAAGAEGLAPAPAAGAQGKYLRGDGTWQTPPNTTYAAMTGATATAAGKTGLVPAPAAGKQSQYLRGDGTWSTPVNTTYGQATESTLGLVKVDTDVSDGSTNPVQNQAVQAYVSTQIRTITSALSNYAKKSDIVGMYKYKGSVADASKLPTTGQVTGDVYNIEAASSYGGAGMNVAWDGSKWDPLGEIFTIASISNSTIDTICV